MQSSAQPQAQQQQAQIASTSPHQPAQQPIYQVIGPLQPMYPPDSNFYVLGNYAYMPNALHSQATMLPQAFQTMTPQDPSWNMDTGSSSHLADNTANPLQPTAHFISASPTPPPNTHLVIHIPYSLTSVTHLDHTQPLTNTSLPTQSDTTHPTSYTANPTQTVSMHPMVTRAKARIFKPLERMTYHVTTTSPLPHSHVHALWDSNWKEAMLDEYNALISNGTWVLVPHPANVNVVCSMWLFKHKFHIYGSLSRYKDCLVANGRSQQQGIDCDETFSSVVKPATIHTVLSLAVPHDWLIHHLDVKNAFLYVYLTETVYMHQPPEFIDYGRPDYRTASGLFLSPSKFAEEILERTHMQHCNPYRTPVDTESKLGPDDISYVVQQVYLYMHDPREPHLVALKRISRYVHGTLNHGLQLHVSTTNQLTEYTDADWAGCPVTRDPLLDAEYHGVANVVVETAWIRNLLLELHAPLHSVTLVYCENVSVVYLSTNSVQHKRTKHIEIDIHFVRDYVASRQVPVLYLSSRFQYADIFTKGLLSALFLEFCSSLNVRTPHVLTAGEY
nr:ribonuclease H-like domain-containing protein [Tanacetum cinerariifolium]